MNMIVTFKTKMENNTTTYHRFLFQMRLDNIWLAPDEAVVEPLHASTHGTKPSLQKQK